MPLNPVPNFPVSLDSLPDPTSATYEDADGFEIDLLLQKLNAIVEALEVKLGIGADTAAVNELLVGTATGATAFRKLLNADVDAAAAIAYSKLNLAASITSADIVQQTITGGTSGAASDIGTNTIAGSAGALNNILAQSISTADLALNSITQRTSAVGSSSSPTTTSGTYVDMTDMSVTLTTTGGDLLVWFAGTIQNSTSGQGVKAALSLDGAAEVNGATFVTAAANQQASLALVHRFAAPSSASHTVKVRWFVSGGTGTAVGTDRSVVMQEVKR